MPKQPNPIDVYVGRRLRLHRMAVGMSQQKLAEALGLTFQQVQKYEKGANRIGASRLFAISHILGIPVQSFFEDIPDEVYENVPYLSASPDRPEPSSGDLNLIHSTEGVKLSIYFSQIDSSETRRRLVELVKVLANRNK